MFSNTGSLKGAIETLKQKAMKAAFSLKSSLASQNICSPALFMRLFDKLIKPILLYGCEVWAQEILRLKKITLTKLNKFPPEQIHIKLCKWALGLRKSTNNNATRAELGRYPIYIDIIKQTQNYSSRFEQLPDERIAKKAYLNEIKSKGDTWYESTKIFADSWGLTNSEGKNLKE